MHSKYNGVFLVEAVVRTRLIKPLGNLYIYVKAIRLKPATDSFEVVLGI